MTAARTPPWGGVPPLRGPSGHPRAAIFAHADAVRMAPCVVAQARNQVGCAHATPTRPDAGADQ